jgi:hypothetical protein
LAAGVLLTALGACSSTTSLPPADGKLALGTWGSDSAGMIVSDTSTHLHIKCTFGDMSGRVVLNSSGEFDVAGTYLLRAYPIAIGPPLPARFVGRVSGADATVTVTVNDTVQRQTVVLGPVTVRYATQPKLWPCPICRRPILMLPAGDAAHGIP